MIPLDNLVPKAIIYCRKAPEPVIARFLREAAREFCQVMPVWTEAATHEVETPAFEILTPPEDAEIVAIYNALLDETSLTPVTPGFLDKNHPNWMNETDGGAARYLTQLGPDSVTLYPLATGTLTMRYHLKPSDEAENLPDVLATRYAEIIARGAVGQMMVLPDTEYTNPSLGAAHLAYFASKITFGAKMRAHAGQQGAPIRTTPRYF